MTIERNRSRTAEPIWGTFDLVNQDGATIYSVAQLQSSKVETMTDTVTPGFQERIANGEIINNPMTFTSSSECVSEESAVLTDTNIVDPSKVNHSASGNVTKQFLEYAYSPWIGNPLDPLTEGNLADVARQKCLAFVDRTPVALAEDLGEIRETIQFLKSPIQSLERLTKAFVDNKNALKYLKKAHPLEFAQAMADLWKTYRFAVAPLMRSVVDVLELAANKPPNRPKRQRASGRSRKTDESVEPRVYRATPSWMSQVYVYHALGYRELNFHATILYEVSNPLEDWKWKLGLRLKDLPTTGWELLPYSFMVDRLLDIRSFFAGAINVLDPNVTFLAGSTTKRDLSQYTYSLVHTEYAGLTREISKPDFVQYEDFVMTRSVWNPSFFDAIPSFTPRGLVKDLTSILDLLAILLGFVPSVNPD